MGEQQQVTRIPIWHGCIYFNCEQDLDIAGLKECKGRYHPCVYLKKYTVGLKQEEASSRAPV